MFSTWENASWRDAEARSERDGLARFLAGIDRLLVSAAAALAICVVLLLVR